MALRCGLAVTLATLLACGSGAALGGGSAQPERPPHTMETVIQDDALLLHRPAAEVRRTAQRMANLGADRVRLTASWGRSRPAPRTGASPDSMPPTQASTRGSRSPGSTAR